MTSTAAQRLWLGICGRSNVAKRLFAPHLVLSLLAGLAISSRLGAAVAARSIVRWNDVDRMYVDFAAFVCLTLALASDEFDVGICALVTIVATNAAPLVWALLAISRFTPVHLLIGGFTLANLLLIPPVLGPAGIAPLVGDLAVLFVVAKTNNDGDARYPPVSTNRTLSVS
jgi:hypothetical protein